MGKITHASPMEVGKSQPYARQYSVITNEYVARDGQSRIVLEGNVVNED